MNKKAFSMVELIFVIVILGILAGVAIPKLVGSREDAYIAKGKNQIASIKNGINLKASSNLLSGGGCGGSGRYPVDLNQTDTTSNFSSTYSSVGVGLFNGVLQEPIISSNSDGGWMATGTYRNGATEKDFEPETYRYTISTGRTVTFRYYNTSSGSIKAGTFYCDPNDATTGNDCKTLTK